MSNDKASLTDGGWGETSCEAPASLSYILKMGLFFSWPIGGDTNSRFHALNMDVSCSNPVNVKWQSIAQTIKTMRVKEWTLPSQSIATFNKPSHLKNRKRAWISFGLFHVICYWICFISCFILDIYGMRFLVLSETIVTQLAFLWVK